MGRRGDEVLVNKTIKHINDDNSNNENITVSTSTDNDKHLTAYINDNGDYSKRSGQEKPMIGKSDTI